VKPEPDWARAVALARRERGVRGGRGARQRLAFAVFLAAGLHAAAGTASLGAASDVPVARTVGKQQMNASVFAVCFVAIATQASAQNFILNGGFERGAAQQACEWLLHSVGSTTLQGWSVLDGNVDRQRLAASCDATFAGWRSHEGEFTLDLNGSVAGAIQQSIDVLPGQPMRLRFMLTGNCSAWTAGQPRSIQVEIDGTTWTFEHHCVAEYPQPWVEHIIDFTPKANRTSIVFRSLTPNTTLGPVIDDIRLWEVQPNRVRNAGFEIGAEQGACAWVLHAAGSTAIPEWTVGSGTVDRQRLAPTCGQKNAGWQSFEGDYTIDVNGFEPGSIWQTVRLIPNVPSRLSFQLTGNCNSASVGASRTIRVDIAGISRTFQVECTGGYPQVWVPCTLDFVPTSSTTDLVFTSLTESTTLGPVIDSVSVVQHVGACPADVIENGVVDGADLAAVLTTWGTNGGIYPRADTNADGVVDGNDLAVVLGGWGACP
jgi:hypothetical protein